jgi:hypothetical protein
MMYTSSLKCGASLGLKQLHSTTLVFVHTRRKTMYSKTLKIGVQMHCAAICDPKCFALKGQERFHSNELVKFHCCKLDRNICNI